MAPYTRRAPDRTTLHTLVREHLATFLDHCRERADGHDVPAFVRRAFLRYLDCGVLQKGFCRFRCEGCGYDHLVALRSRVAAGRRSRRLPCRRRSLMPARPFAARVRGRTGDRTASPSAPPR